MKNNPNTPDFWDTLVEKVENISPDDYITKDRMKFIASLIPKLDIKLLDVGVGYGFLEKKLENSPVSLYGMDISHKAIFRAKSLYRGSFVVASVRSVPFKNNFFDVVCIPEVLEHLYDTESTLVMKEISRVLKSNGRLIISVPLYDEVYSGHPSGHVRVFTPEKLFEEINNNGFTVVKEKYLFAFKSFYFIKNLINWLLRINRPNNLIVLAKKTALDDLAGRVFGYSDGIVVARKREKGDKGEERDKREKGDKGKKGDRGDRGIEGEKGEKGERDKKEEKGEGKTMNILFLTPRDSGKSLGGVERHVKLLTEELVRRGYRVKELSLEEADVTGSKRETPCHTARSHPFFAWKYLWDRRELFGWAEVVHVHDVFWWVVPFLPIIYYKSFKESPCHAARRHLKRRIFVTFHGWEGVCPPTRSAVWQKRLAAFLSDGTIGVGSFFEKWYGVKTDRVVWGVLDKNYKNYKDYKEKDKKEQKDQKGEGKTVFFGRLEEVNGIEVVIKAMKSIRGHKVRPWRPPAGVASTPRSDLSIVFVGDGAWRARAESVGEVTGMVKEPWKYLVDAEVVIASSYLAILEAVAMGKRVIAVANNPLKRDYLEGHPMREYFKIVESVEELVGEIRDKSYKGYKDYKEKEKKEQKDQKGEGNTWALGQTAEKLADEYEELWAIK